MSRLGMRGCNICLSELQITDKDRWIMPERKVESTMLNSKSLDNWTLGIFYIPTLYLNLLHDSCAFSMPGIYEWNGEGCILERNGLQG
jgi:hypothetical protein